VNSCHDSHHKSSNVDSYHDSHHKSSSVDSCDDSHHKFSSVGWGMISSSNVMVCNAFGLIGSLTVLTFLHFRCIVHNIPTKGSLSFRWSHRFGSFAVAIMTWLTATEYMWYKWSRIYSIWRNHTAVISSSMTHHLVYNKINTTGVIYGAVTPDLFRASEFILVFSRFCIARSLIFWIIVYLLYFFFWSLCCLFFFNCRLLITPLVSSNSSWKWLYSH
jgi:hypothetical protein